MNTNGQCLNDDRQPEYPEWQVANLPEVVAHACEKASVDCR